MNKYFRNKGFKTCFHPIDSLIFFFSLRQLIQFSPLSDWLQSPLMRQQGLQFFSSQSDKVKNMKDTLNQSLVWTVSVWITAEQSGKYGRLAAGNGKWLIFEVAMKEPCCYSNWCAQLQPNQLKKWFWCQTITPCNIDRWFWKNSNMLLCKDGWGQFGVATFANGHFRRLKQEKWR